MENHRKSTQNSGFFGSLLAVLFIGLKLTGHIDWSWWLVLSPVYVPVLLAVILLTVIAVVTK